MRYFYRRNYFPDVKVHETIEKLHDIISNPDNFETNLRYMHNGYNLTMGEISEMRFPKPPPEFDHAGWDVRTLTYDSVFHEVDAKFYHESLVPLEEEILKDEMTIRAGLTAWHTPIQTIFEDGDDEIKVMLSNRFKIKLEEVELITLEE